jgi:hypothetical protein
MLRALQGMLLLLLLFHKLLLLLLLHKLRLRSCLPIKSMGEHVSTTVHCWELVSDV